MLSNSENTTVDDRGTGADVLAVIGQRVDLLEAVAEEPMHKQQLADELAVSRSTVNRAVATLQEHALVDASEHEIALSPTGRLSLESYDDAVRAIGTIAAASDLLADAEADFPLPVDVLRDASVHRATDDDRYCVTRAFLDRLADADHITAVRGPLRPELPPSLAERARAGDLTGEVGLTSDSLDYLAAYHAGDLDAILALDGVTVYRLQKSLSHGLYVLERGGTREIYLTVQNEQHDVRGFIHTDRPAAVDWGTRSIEDRFGDATVYEPG